MVISDEPMRPLPEGPPGAVATASQYLNITADGNENIHRYPYDPPSTSWLLTDGRGLHYCPACAFPLPSFCRVAQYCVPRFARGQHNVEGKRWLAWLIETGLGQDGGELHTLTPLPF